MKRQIGWTLVTLATAAAGAVSFPAGDGAPVPGPGGVIHAVREFVAAVDAGDAAVLRGAFADSGPGGLYGFTDGGEVRHLDSAGKIAFYDVAEDGGSIHETDPAAAIARIRDSIGGTGRGLETTLRTIRANCPSENCSYAVVEFDRAYGRGDQLQTVPMQATALVRYFSDAPHFRIFHWHASRRQAAPAK